MNQAVAVIDPPPMRATARNREVIAIIPRDMDEVFHLASCTYRARMAPESFKSAEQVAIAIMHGMEVGFTPMAAIQSIAVINGRPAIWGDGALALVQGSGLLEEHEEGVRGEGDQLTGWCRVKRTGKSPDEKTFSIADAKKAELMGKDPWKKYPQRMVLMRARSWALRDNFADVLKGIYIAEEAMDMDRSLERPAAPVPPTPPKIAVAGAVPAITNATQEKAAVVVEARVVEEDPFTAMQAAQTSAPAAQQARPTPPVPPAAKAPIPPTPPAAMAPTPTTPPTPPAAKAPAPPVPPAAKTQVRPAPVVQRDIDPEAIISEFQDALDAQRDAAGVYEVWNDIVTPVAGDLFPPDLTTLTTMRDKKLSRLG